MSATARRHSAACRQPAGVHDLDRHAAALRPHRAVRQRRHQRRRAAPAEHPGRMAVDTGVSGPHMPRTNRYSTPPRCRSGSIARLSPPQEAVQHNAVQQRLQRIVRVQHGLDQPRSVVVGSGQRPIRVAQPVRLVVDHQIALPPPIRQSAAPRRPSRSDIRAAAGRPAPSPVKPVGVGGQRIGRPAGARRSSTPDVGQPNDPARRPAGRRRPAETRSPSPAIGPADPIWRSVNPPANGPSGVSCIGTIAAASSAAGTSTGHHTECRGSAPRVRRSRSAANGSAVSSTACTSVPNFAPVGSSAIGDGMSGPGRRLDQRNVADFVVQLGDLRLTAHPSSSSAARISPEYEVRRHAVSMARWKWRASRSDGRAWPAWRGGRGDHRLLEHRSAGGLPLPKHGPARRRRRSWPASQRSGTTDSPGRRPRSSRDSPPLGSSHDGDHHATTCDCARVIAT